MGDALLVALAVSAAMAASGMLGAPISLLTARGRASSWTIAALSPILGLALWICVTSAIYVLLPLSGFNLLWTALFVSVALSVIAGAVVIRTGKWPSSVFRDRGDIVWGVVFGLLTVSATAVALLPGFAPNRKLTFTTGIGPDAIGYAVASQAMSGSEPLPILKASLARAFPTWPQDLVLSPLTYGVNGLASVTQQIQAEFLVGAGRFGLAAASLPFLLLWGPSGIWSAHAVVYVVALLLSALVLASICARLRRPFWYGLAGGVVLVGSGLLLYAWWQGGSAQVLCLPLTLLTVRGVLELPSWRGIVLSGLGLGATLSTYADAWPLLVFVIAIALGLNGRNQYWRLVTLGSWVVAAVLSLVLAAPVSSRIGTTIAKRALDTGQGGWPIPGQPGLSTLLGLDQVDRIGDTGGASPALPWTIPILLLGLGLVFAGRMRGTRVGLLIVLSGTALVTFWLSYVWAILSGFSNYTPIKSGVVLWPLVLTGVICLLPHLGSSDQDQPSHSASQSQGPRKSIVGIAVLAVTIASIASTYAWADQWRRNAFYLNPALLAEPHAQSLAREMSRFTFVGTQPWLIALAPSGDFEWLTRSSRIASAVPPRGELAYLSAALDVGGNRPSTSRSEVPNALQLAPDIFAIPLGIPAHSTSGLSLAEICAVAQSALFTSRGLIASDPCNVNSISVNAVGLATQQQVSMPAKALADSNFRCPNMTVVWPSQFRGTLATFAGPDGSMELRVNPSGDVWVLLEKNVGASRTRIGQGRSESWNVLKISPGPTWSWRMGDLQVESTVGRFRCANVALGFDPDGLHSITLISSLEVEVDE